MGAYEEKLVYESYNDVMLSISKIQWNTSRYMPCKFTFWQPRTLTTLSLLRIIIN